MHTTAWKAAAYWAVTGLFAGLMLLSAFLYLSGAAIIRDTLAHLGYPAYLVTILGTAKLLGTPALLQRRLPTLREWAYAGFSIDLIGATASHLFSGDPISIAIVPALILALLAVSYALQPAARAIPAGSLGRTRAVAA